MSFRGVGERGINPEGTSLGLRESGEDKFQKPRGSHTQDQTRVYLLGVKGKVHVRNQEVLQYKN